ncbi:MAG: iron-sulfur cluster carrier protein ApbC [Methylococcaceae bacterium]|nr:iron-sulfur cluster carrier protein ApbC [Methylococcaceae bacterium]
MANTKTAIENVLGAWIDPYLEQDLVSARTVKRITIEGSQASVRIVLGYPAKGYLESLTNQIKERLLDVPGIAAVDLEIASEIVSHAVQKNLKPMPNVKNIIAIASGKGGVGKSTTAVNIALALSADGASVGILDADIYGPSQPMMLGLSGNPESLDGKTMEPKVAFGIQSISIGYLIDEDTPMIWRGPMVTNALQQLLNNTRWTGLDYMIVDLPPGTGDIQLTLSQQIPVSGAVIITTPQDISLLDAQKGLKMFQKVDVPVLGIVENMSTHICSKCGHEEAIFGSGGGEAMSKRHGVDLLGSLPLDISIRKNADSGHPTVVAEPDSRIAQIYRQIARKTAAKLALRKKDQRGLFPHIVVKNP